MWFWICSTLFWTFVMSFYSMQEMACISFNRLRLEVAVREGSTRARCIKKMLDNPMMLFTTTLIGVNFALVLSSESMRQVFSTLDLNPNLSPIVEAPYMIVCGELVPMFAARLFPEHMARLGIPFLWLSSRLLRPLTFSIEKIGQGFRFLFSPKRQKKKVHRFQRDDLRELLEKRKSSFNQDPSFESLISQIFNLRELPIAGFMTPLNKFPSVKDSFLVRSVRELLCQKHSTCAIVRNTRGAILGYVHAKELIGASQTSSIKSLICSGTFINEQTNGINALFVLQKEQVQQAFTIDRSGEITGVISLDTLLKNLVSSSGADQLLHIEKTVPAQMYIDEFLHRYRLNVPKLPASTFGELVEKLLGHKPSLHDSAHFGPLEITVVEVGVRGAKTVLVKTQI